MTSRSCLTWSVGLLLAAACQTPPVGFDAARLSLERGDLIGALVRFDQVPPGDPDYAEARSLAAAVERRIRTSQRLFARGLSLRAQWRDDEAIETFELAREVWPRLDGVDSLIDATRRRIVALDIASSPALPDAEAGLVTMTTPVTDEPVLAASVSEGVSDPTLVALTVEPHDGQDFAEERAGEVGDPAPDDPLDDPVPADPEPLAAPMVETAPTPGPTPPDPTQESLTVPAASDETVVQARLQDVAAELRRGQVDEALDDLRAMQTAWPDADRVRELLVRVLHQRALVHYGQGELARAVDVWAELLHIETDHRQAREFHDAASSELEALRRR